MTYRLENLDKKTKYQFSRAIIAIPSKTTHLDLSRNNLGDRTMKELIWAFSILSPNITSLNLSHNNLGNKTNEELAQLIFTLPSELESLNLRHNNLKGRCLEIWINLLFIQLRHCIHTEDLLFISAQSSIPILTESDTLPTNFELAKIIQHLENKKILIAYLACALLLSGTFDCFGNPHEEPEKQEYWLKRQHDAISFYCKAYEIENDKIRFSVAMLLSKMKVANTESSIIKRLNSFDFSFLFKYRIFHENFTTHKVQLPDLWLHQGFFVKPNNESPDNGSSSNAVPTIKYRSRA